MLSIHSSAVVFVFVVQVLFAQSFLQQIIMWAEYILSVKQTMWALEADQTSFVTEWPLTNSAILANAHNFFWNLSFPIYKKYEEDIMHGIVRRKDVKYNVSDKVPGSHGQTPKLAVFSFKWIELLNILKSVS